MKANEQNFVALIRQRREEGILYVIEKYGGFLQAVVKKRLYAMPDRTEECMNDVFWGIWKNIGSFDEEKSSFQNWAAGVARLEAIDCLRKVQRELATVNLDDVEIAKEDRMLSALVEKELSEETESLLSCLSPGDRELFLRIYANQEEPADVGRELGMSRENLYVRIFRGKKKLRNHAAGRKGMRI